MTSKIKKIALCDRLMFVKCREMEEKKKEYLQMIKDHKDKQREMELNNKKHNSDSESSVDER
jgi:hypothetical protein